MTKEEYLEKLQTLPQFRGCIASRNQARQLPTGLSIGDIFWIENEEKAQIVIDKGKKDLVFTDLDMNATVSTGMTIYDLNKKVVAQEPLFDFGNQHDKQDLEDNIKMWFNINHAEDRYFLLYGRDIHYFTLFDKVDKSLDLIAVLECIASVGDLVSIDFEDNAMEIWVRTDKEPAILLYLLPYDSGIVEI